MSLLGLYPTNLNTGMNLSFSWPAREGQALVVVCSMHCDWHPVQTQQGWGFLPSFWQLHFSFVTESHLRSQGLSRTHCSRLSLLMSPLLVGVLDGFPVSSQAETHPVSGLPLPDAVSLLIRCDTNRVTSVAGSPSCQQPAHSGLSLWQHTTPKSAANQTAGTEPQDTTLQVHTTPMLLPHQWVLKSGMAACLSGCV